MYFVLKYQTSQIATTWLILTTLSTSKNEVT